MAAQPGEPPSTEATAVLDFETPLLAEAVRRVVAGSSDSVERAVLIHAFVRDEVPFGWDPAFDSQTASETLAAAIGFCNTKTNLFVAMLRGAGIPARMHMVGINKHILDGMINPIDKYVDHSYAEVYLEGRWLAVDSHIVDSGLFRAAMPKLKASGRKIGFGVHANGTREWDGRSDSFSQFLDDGSCPDLSDVDFGVYDDLAAFYASGQARTSRNVIFRRVILRTLTHFGNRKVRALRRSADASRAGSGRLAAS